MKKQLSIAMSLIVLMNSAPIFALETSQSGTFPKNGVEGVPAAPTADLEQELVGVASDPAAKELAAVIGAQRKKMYSQVLQMVDLFKKQKALIDSERNPTIQNLLKVQTFLTFAGTMGVGNNETNKLFGGKKGLLLGNVSTIINGLISAIRLMDSSDPMSANAKVNREKMQKDTQLAMEKIKSMFNDSSLNVPVPILQLQDRLRDISDSLMKLDDNASTTKYAEYVRIGSAAMSVFFLIGHFVNPKLTDEAEKAVEGAAQQIGKLQKFKNGLATKAVSGSNGTNLVGNLGVEGITQLLGISSADATKETKAIMDKLGTAIDVFEQVASAQSK